MMKESDKMTSAENHEIESREITKCLKSTRKMGKTERKHPFNIFWTASVTDNCGSYRLKSRHFTGTDATQIMLKYGIYPCSPHGQFDKILIINKIQKRPKNRIFPTKVEVVWKNGKDLRLFCEK